MTEDTTDQVDEQTELELATARARRRLLDAPALIGWIREQVIPNMGGAQDGMPRAASKTAPLPLRADAVDDGDQAYARLLEWLSYWSAELNSTPPTPVLTKWQLKDEPAGFRPGTTPAGAELLVSIVTGWLLARQDRILEHTAARTYLDDVADMIWDLRAKYPMSPRPQRGVLDRACPVCDHFAFGATWTGKGVSDFELRCSHCGHVETAGNFIKSRRVRELLHELREEHADPKSEWWTKRQAVNELGITVQTLNRYIQKDGLSVYTAGGTVMVNVEDLLEIYRGKKLSERRGQAITG